MVKSLLFVTSALLLGAAQISNPVGTAQETPAPAHSTTPGKPNPVKPTAESQAKAKKIYGFDCALCHGEKGDGKTDLAKDMGLTINDMSDPKTLSAVSDADLFDIIRKGKDKMPPEDPARAKDDDVWNLVIYIRGLSKGSATAATNGAGGSN